VSKSSSPLISRNLLLVVAEVLLLVVAEVLLLVVAEGVVQNLLLVAAPLMQNF
jgi:hypothetical protein